MYSRNYGRGDISAKITPPPAYSGSAIQSKDTGGINEGREESKSTPNSFAPFSQTIPFPKPQEEEKEEKPCPPPYEERGECCERETQEHHEHCEHCEHCEHHEKREHRDCPPSAHRPKEKEQNSLLSGFLSDFSTEDLILIGIIIALAFDLADRDILLVALVVAVVLM